MAGIPTILDVQTQWDALVTMLEKMRRWGDDELISLMENVEQSAKGNYTPQGFANYSAGTRAGFQSLITGARAAAGHQPMLYEFGTVIESPYRDILFVFRDVYDYIHANSLQVPSREITFGAPTPKGTPEGNGFLTRMTRDWNDYDTEAVRVEDKSVICRLDQSSGARKHAEIFEVYGEQPSIDALQLQVFGTGVRGTITSRHAGNGVGGSLLVNSSFSQFDGTNFSGWAASGTVAQDLVNFYRSYPGASVDASAIMDPSSTLTQLLSQSGGAQSLEINTPYFLRVMINAAAYSASGPFSMRIGGVTVNVVDVSLHPEIGGWGEVTIPIDKDSWYRNFNQQDLDVELSFTGVGQLLVDDMLFTPWDAIDGSYMVMRGGPVPWLLDDQYDISDAQADATKGLRNYWTYLAGLGYLPNTSRGAPVGWNDPTIP